jgi:hypothetical protein
MANLTTRQHVTFTLNPLRDDGTPGQVQAGSVVVSSSDETVIMVALDPANELSGDVMAVAESAMDPDGNPAPSRFVVRADADMGQGTVTITGTSEDIFVTMDPRDTATSFTITMGVPQDKAAPAPAPGP